MDLSPPGKEQKKEKVHYPELELTMQKKGGRPSGTPHRPYNAAEIEAAFSCLIEECPASLTGSNFITQMQTAMHSVTGVQRTQSGLRTFVGSKLREWVPELYSLKFGKDKTPTPRQLFFLREYMRDTAWEPPHKRTAVKHESGESSGIGKSKESGREVKRPWEAGPNPFFSKSFSPNVASTPINKPQAGPSNASGSRGERPCTEDVDDRIRVLVTEYFVDFREEIMQQVKELCGGSKEKRRRTDDGDEHQSQECTQKNEEEEEVMKMEGTSHEGIQIDPQTEDNREWNFSQKEEPHELDDNSTEEEDEAAEDTEEKESDNKKGDEQEENESPTAKLSTHLVDTTDDELVRIALSEEERASFAASPLRAKLSTLTVVEIYKLTEGQKPTDESPFHVLEEEDGSLSICHSSTLEGGNWSTDATVDHYDTTLQKELDSIAKDDIVDLSKDGQILSPMKVGKVSQLKRKYGMATILTKGRAVRALIKQKDE